MLYAISLTEGAAAHEQWLRTRGACYGADVRERMQLGLLVPATTYLKAQRLRATLRHDLDQVFQQVDFLATPTTAIPAPSSTPVQVKSVRPRAPCVSPYGASCSRSI
jgi:Asp-tRNA(Asn)/Glu-tRNA(Gln) amidotransferase A subunit family amidase